MSALVSAVDCEYGWRDAAKTESHGYLVPPLMRHLAALSRGTPLRILDLGCGNGYVSAQMAAMGHTVVAVDASLEGIELSLIHI